MATRFGTASNQDNTGRVLTLAYTAPTYAATLALTPNASVTYYMPTQLTGALTINLTTTSAQICDELIIACNADGTQRIVTLGTGFVSGGTLTCAISKNVSARFVFNGTSFIEVGRFVQP